MPLSARSDQVPVEKIEAIHRVVDSRHVGIAFQPIVDVRTRKAHAYESLARSPTPVFAGPQELFAAAVQAGRVGELGRLHRESATRICAGKMLFMNVDPHEFDQGWLVRPDDPIFQHRGGVTVEITEAVPISYFAQCHSVLAEIRRKGIQLAIDDFGAGFSNLKYIVDLEPEVVKLDRQLVMGTKPGSRQHKLVEAIVHLCHGMGSRVIAEGIETPEELHAVIVAGVDYVQGFLLARPAHPPPDVVWPHLLF